MLEKYKMLFVIAVLFQSIYIKNLSIFRQKKTRFKSIWHWCDSKIHMLFPWACYIPLKHYIQQTDYTICVWKQWKIVLLYSILMLICLAYSQIHNTGYQLSFTEHMLLSTTHIVLKTNSRAQGPIIIPLSPKHQHFEYDVYYRAVL